MKNASKYAETLRHLLKSLLREGKPEPAQKMEPLKALIRGAMSFDVSDTRAHEAMRLIERDFVNTNELRVATDLEIQELLGTRYPSIERRVEMITRSLNSIFEREHTLSLDRLRNIGKKEARQFLRDLPAIHPFVEAYVMLFGFETPAVPLDDEMLRYLREEGMFEEKTTLEEAQRFLENNLKGDECYEFYACVRRAALGDARAKKRAKN
jgi:endonuclease III